MITRSNKIFCLCLTGVICLAVGAVMGPRYFSRILDLRDLNTVSIINRDQFYFLEQSSDQLVDQVKLLNSIGNSGNLMLLSNYSDQETWQNSTLIAQITDQVALAAGDGYIPWLEPGIYENYFMEIMKKQASKEAPAFYDWMNELKFAKYYSLTCESDPDSHMMQMMNLWYLRFSDEQTFDYYFLVNASTCQIYYAEIYNLLTDREADDSWTESPQNAATVAEVFYGEEYAEQFASGAFYYYQASDFQTVYGDEGRNYDCLSVLRLEEGESAYIEMQKHEKNTQLKHPIYGYSVGIRGLADKIQKNMN
ncbi:hypothetical protein KE530_00340 [Clostridiaceae bacterium Marseille-Q4145]|nr:hypothetical protein [Clostridiaceae bacterium Marseille-Q4145]